MTNLAKRFIRLAAILCLVLAANAQIASNALSTPVAPLRPVTYRGFTNAIVLQNELMRAVIVPEIGRIVELNLLDSESPLRTDAMLDRGKSTDTNGWANYGGSWLWPAAQNRWAETYGRNWPPPRFDSLPWTAAAWRRADGADFCRLQLSIADPLHVRITRDMVLPRKSARLQITQRAERILASTMPVTLWNVVQIAATDEVIIPVDTDPSNSDTRGLVPLYDNHIPPEQILAATNAVVLLPPTIKENKVGSASPRSWIAARRGHSLIVLRSAPGDAGTYPDGGSRVTMYSNTGLGYTEIESNSEERNLAPGETLANTITIELYRLPEKITGHALATWTRQILGELSFPKPDETKLLRPSQP